MKNTGKIYTQEEYNELKKRNVELHDELQQFINCVVRNTIKLNNTFNNGQYNSKTITDTMDSLVNYVCSYYRPIHIFSLRERIKSRFRKK